MKSQRGMRFGIFSPPAHRLPYNPTLALRREIQLVEHLDVLGYDEAWIGEHHSSGVEVISSPELIIAAAAERTTHIKLGTGVISAPYHHPFMVAERAMLLDHLTRGRFMLGLGPGQLLRDAYMLGMDTADLRPRFEEALDVIIRLLEGEVVNQSTDWFTCRDAELQLELFSDLDAALTSAISPSGPKLAGRYGTGMLGLAATNPIGIEKLAEQWEIAATEAQRHGRQVSRDDWRLVGPMHIAETMEQAIADVQEGLPWLLNYLSHVDPTIVTGDATVRQLVDGMNETGAGVIGTPDMAIAQLERLAEKSGGFGCYLFLNMDFAPWDATLRRYELFANEVMPVVQGQTRGLTASWDALEESGSTGAEATRQAQEAAAARFKAEREVRG